VGGARFCGRQTSLLSCLFGASLRSRDAFGCGFASLAGRLAHRFARVTRLGVASLHWRVGASHGFAHPPAWHIGRGLGREPYWDPLGSGEPRRAATQRCAGPGKHSTQGHPERGAAKVNPSHASAKRERSDEAPRPRRGASPFATRRSPGGSGGELLEFISKSEEGRVAPPLLKTRDAPPKNYEQTLFRPPRFAS